MIECGSASSFELSPRFANHPFRERLSSQEQFHQDVENEIEEAMSDTIQGAKDDKNDLDGKYITSKNKSIIELRLTLSRKFGAGCPKNLINQPGLSVPD